MRIFSSVVIAATVVAISACGKSNPVSPAAESSATPAAAHATIQMKGVVGTIGNGSFTVAGQTVTTNANTQFSLNGVAAGPSALVAGRNVEVEGTTTNSGSLLASSVAIESEQEVEHPVPEPQPEPEVEIKGLVQGFTGSPASFQFQINGSPISGNGSTIFDGSLFADLKNGASVEVKGVHQTASILATRIRIEEANEPAPPPQQQEQQLLQIEFTGLLTSKSGASPVFTLVVGGHTVHTTAATSFRRHGDPVDPNVLQTGMTLEVEGTQRADGSVDATKVTIEEAEELEVRLQGPISGLTGACPALQFTVNGATVVTSSSTDFRTSCGALQNTLNVEVRGLRLSNGNVSATRIEKK